MKTIETLRNNVKDDNNDMLYKVISDEVNKFIESYKLGDHIVACQLEEDLELEKIVILVEVKDTLRRLKKSKDAKSDLVAMVEFAKDYTRKSMIDFLNDNLSDRVCCVSIHSIPISIMMG